MGLLNTAIKKVEKADSKSTAGSVSNATSVPTGVSSLDYFGGTVTTYEGDQVIQPGIAMGKIGLLVGQSQSGKTTLAIKMAYNVVKDLNGDVILADFERSSGPTIHSRIGEITGADAETVANTFSVLRNETLTTEGLLEIITNLAIAKEDMGKDAMVDYYDSNFKPIKIYAPTVVIIDSISAMRPKELLEKKGLDSNMVGAMVAKTNSGFVTALLPLMEKFNITVIGI